MDKEVVEKEVKKERKEAKKERKEAKKVKEEKLLIHACCAPCLVAVWNYILANLQEFSLNTVENLDVMWYNTNIHPKVEYEHRKETLKSYLNMVGKEGIFIDEYNMREFITGAMNFEKLGYSCRCEYCYTMRLEKVFAYAKEHGYTLVTTTLLISPYQKHDIIIKVCKKLEEKYGVGFAYKDFRPYFRDGQNMARELGLYRQKFCGCIFSIDEGGKITIT